VDLPRDPLPAAVRQACRLDCQSGFAIVPLPAEPAAADTEQELVGSVVMRLNLFECEFMQPA
jgi:hypothetical protein